MSSQIIEDPALVEFKRHINWRDETSFNHAREIHKPYGELDAILKWCKSELVEEWRWQMVDMSMPQRPGRYIFYFDNERDYLAFCLKWA